MLTERCWILGLYLKPNSRKLHVTLADLKSRPECLQSFSCRVCASSTSLLGSHVAAYSRLFLSEALDAAEETTESSKAEQTENLGVPCGKSNPVCFPRNPRAPCAPCCASSVTSSWPSTSSRSTSSTAGPGPSPASAAAATSLSGSSRSIPGSVGERRRQPRGAGQRRDSGKRMEL